MKKIIIFISLFLATSIFANEITLKFIKSMPMSLYRDFYIERFFKQDISPKEAEEAFGLIKKVTWSKIYKYAKKSEDKDLKRVVKCKKMGMYSLLSQDNDCFEIGVSAYKLRQLAETKNSKKIDLAYKRLGNSYPYSKPIFDIYNSKNIYSSWLKASPSAFFGAFNTATKSLQETTFNKEIPKSTLKRVETSRKINRFINLVITNPKLEKLHKSLFQVKTEALKDKAAFMLAMNGIRYNKLSNVVKYLEHSYKKAYYQFDKDKSLFWLYLVTNDKSYLKTLSSSWDINFYSLWALEELGKPYPKIDYDLDVRNKKSNIDKTDPFVWVDILDKIKYLKGDKLDRYIDKFSYQDTKPYLAFIKERTTKESKGYFITPNEDYLKGVPNQRKALFYAIGRQESRFIPTALSRSYAMGVMQIMPFLSRALAKELKDKEFTLDNMFNPKHNYRYANHHLNFLEKRLKHPLFISYGYNGGIGFTRRKVLKKLFKDSSKFEPYLSMELVPYSESRRYGKKVLANYVIYAKKFGLNTSVHKLIDEIKKK